jgi:hypothetical protein
MGEDYENVILVNDAATDGSEELSGEEIMQPHHTILKPYNMNLSSLNEPIPHGLNSRVHLLNNGMMVIKRMNPLVLE